MTSCCCRSCGSFDFVCLSLPPPPHPHAHAHLHMHMHMHTCTCTHTRTQSWPLGVVASSLLSCVLLHASSASVVCVCVLWGLRAPPQHLALLLLGVLYCAVVDSVCVCVCMCVYVCVCAMVACCLCCSWTTCTSACAATPVPCPCVWCPRGCRSPQWAWCMRWTGMRTAHTWWGWDSEPRGPPPLCTAELVPTHPRPSCRMLPPVRVCVWGGGGMGCLPFPCSACESCVQMVQV
jgi:hypothetical protein